MRRNLPALAALFLAGCGYVAEPLPPLANIPGRVTDLSAVQRSSRLVIQLTVPQLTTEGMPLKPPFTVDVRVGPGPEPFQETGWAAAARKLPEGPISNGKASYEIAAAEWAGKEVVMGARVTGSNGKQSPWALQAVPIVPTPASPGGLRAENIEQGVRLTWSGTGTGFRVFRRSGGDFAEIANVAQPPWIDGTTKYGEMYGYKVQTLVKVGEKQDAESDLTGEVTITPVDQFPPAVPRGLRAAEAPGSVELSWDANSEPDLAGYRVYRSAEGAARQRIAEVEVPAYSDHGAEPGKGYRYEVSSFDRSGNESAPSMPVEARPQ